jgi:Flp pilus assembly pilin Flp
MNSFQRLLRRGRTRARQRGLSTVEYVVILVLIASVAIGTWQVFGERVRRAIGAADNQLLALSEANGGAGLPGGSPSVGGPGSGRTGGGAVTVIPPTPASSGGGAASGGSGGSGSTPPGPVSGLGAGADKIVAKSPNLQGQVQNLLANGWTIKYGKPGKGSFTNGTTITIDPSAKSSSKTAAQLLAHEAGHAMNPAPTVGPSGLTRAQYVQQNTDASLMGEAGAVLNNIEARNEIKANGGPDIGINGKQDKKYEKIYKDYQAGKITRAQAQQQIAQVWGANETTSNSGQNYRKYYEQFYTKDWKKQFPGKPPTFVAP